MPGTEVVFATGISLQIFTRISKKANKTLRRNISFLGMQLTPLSIKGVTYIYFLASSRYKQPLSFQLLHPWEKVAYPIPAIIWIFHLLSEEVWAVTALSPHLGKEGWNTSKWRPSISCKKVVNLCIYNRNQSDIPARCRNQRELDPLVLRVHKLSVKTHRIKGPRSSSPPQFKSPLWLTKGDLITILYLHRRRRPQGLLWCHPLYNKIFFDYKV